MIHFRAKTLKGEESLREALRSVEKAPAIQRKAYNQLYKHCVVSEKPFVFGVESKVGMSAVVIASIFEDNLKAYKLEKEIDYEVKIDE